MRNRRNGKGRPGCGMMKHGPRVATRQALNLQCRVQRRREKVHFKQCEASSLTVNA
ncbi:hypothetical protein WH47_08051 [Habropoda laboriosa]|uniref:Uncharacterized protein n=1 Tax=Habropoda laboriosa TaxID=597456 RepID=A0A0L7QPM9_9HYME|nr:hypothetical protein WH47_08051 [Habropoda laboriosa]